MDLQVIDSADIGAMFDLFPLEVSTQENNEIDPSATGCCSCVFFSIYRRTPDSDVNE